jgi:hypothetical protein
MKINIKTPNVDNQNNPHIQHKKNFFGFMPETINAHQRPNNSPGNGNHVKNVIWGPDGILRGLSFIKPVKKKSK